MACFQPTDKSVEEHLEREQSKGQSERVAVDDTENDPCKEEWAQEHRWSDCSDTIEATERQSEDPVRILAICGVSAMLLNLLKDDATVNY